MTEKNHVQKVTGYPDRWRWVVVVATFFALFLNGSMGYITGVVHVALLQTERYGVEELTWLGSLFNCMFALTGPLASVVIRLGSCRVCVILSGLTCLLGFSLSSIVTDIRLLFLTYGFLAGLGRGFTYTGSLVILGYYFPSNSSLVTGLSIAGVGLGMFIHPRMTQALIDMYGLSGAFLVLGAITSHSCVFGFLMKPSKYERPLEDPEDKKPRKKRYRLKDNIIFVILKNTSFLITLVAVAFFSIAFATVFVLLPDFYRSNGATVQEAALAASITGLGGFMSRLLVGVGANDKTIGPAVFFAGCTGCLGTLTFFITLLNTSSIGRYGYAFSAGLYTGGIFTILSPIVLDRVGVDNLAVSMGLTMFSSGAGSLVGPPMAVAIWDATGLYYSSFLFAGFNFLMASASCFLSEVFKTGDDALSEADKHLQLAITVPDKKEGLADRTSSENSL